MKQYRYIGDKWTRAEWRGAICVAVRRSDGKCVRGKNGNMLVAFGNQKVVVLARLLRKI